MAASLVQTVADHLASIDYTGAPDDVRERARTALLYNLTMGLAGRSASPRVHDSIKTLHAAPGPAVVLGENFRRAAPDAAFINAALITARGQNDTYPALVAHVGCVVIPAAVAASALARCSGARFLSSVLQGYEVIAILGRGVVGEANRRGFRSTPLLGGFGAAAATAGVLGLSVEQTGNALAIAANSAGGLLQCWADGSDEWRLQVANTSRLGMMAALYARDGFSGAGHILEGENGFFRAFSSAVPELDFQGWSIPALTFKPYPGCAFNQAAVHLLRTLLRKEQPAIENIERIVVCMNPVDAAYPGIDAYGPFDTEAGAIMSAPYMLAATLRDGLPEQRHFSSDHQDSELYRLSERIKIRAKSGIERWRCQIEMQLHDGRRLEIATEAREPFSLGWNEILPVLEPVVSEWGGDEPERRFETLVRTISDLEKVDDVDSLTTLLGGSERSDAS